MSFLQTRSLIRHIIYTIAEFSHIRDVSFSDDNKYNSKNPSFNKQKSNANIEIITIEEICSLLMKKNTSVLSPNYNS